MNRLSAQLLIYLLVAGVPSLNRILQYAIFQSCCEDEFYGRDLDILSALGSNFCRLEYAEQTDLSNGREIDKYLETCQPHCSLSSSNIHLLTTLYFKFTMLHAFFSLASGFLYLGNILQGFARGILALRNLEIISSHLLPTLSSPSLPKLLEAPSAPLELPAVFRTLDPSGGLIAIEGPPPVLSAPIPTHTYQSSLEIVTPSNFPGLFLIFITFAIISGFVFLLPELVYIFTTISKIAFAFIHISSKFLGRFWIKSVPNLVPACPPLQLPSSQSLSSRSLITFVSLLLLWTGPPAAASVITFIWISQNFFLQHGSNVISNILQRCGLITETDTRTPHILNAIYEQITHGVAVYDKLAWREDQLDEYNKEHTRVTMDLRVAHPYMGIQLENSEREPRGVLTQENQERDTFALELESENQRLRMQHICTVFVDSQKSLRRQLGFHWLGRKSYGSTCLLLNRTAGD
ncbi:hypothetical protein B0F90DRAFT_892700 [Multifurca ochricompacta]|uniref:Pheromone receptor n=1 Tax=Multifurca ochricompacta TaxID=376703 RepID=A0AAD4M138_9AGAM|nr:hypothetical protein B0F90DRAFT_892700 [Multifurca ochricompacta]